MKSLSAIALTALTFTIAAIAFLAAFDHLTVKTFLISYGLYALAAFGMRVFATLMEPVAIKNLNWQVMVLPESDTDGK
jgi:DNA-binding LytR/AlgR family response regulator